MPRLTEFATPIRFTTLECRTYIIALILLLCEIIPTYSRYILKGLTYIIIITPSSRQPFFYIECTKLHICSSYNI